MHEYQPKDDGLREPAAATDETEDHPVIHLIAQALSEPIGPDEAREMYLSSLSEEERREQEL